jgi:hypothetical protein
MFKTKSLIDSGEPSAAFAAATVGAVLESPVIYSDTQLRWRRLVGFCSPPAHARIP